MSVDAALSPALERALAERLASLTPEQRAFVEQRVRAAHNSGAEAAIPRVPGNGPTILSHAQELLWRIERAAPGLSTYNVPSAVRIAGPLDVSRLRAALDALVARHEALRTTFSEQGGEPQATVAPPQRVAVRLVNLEGTAEPELELAERLRAAAGAPFDLSRDLLLRATLVRLGADAHVLLLVWHHIASDAASRDILFSELGTLYATPDGAAAALPPLVLRYSDFAAWQRAEHSGERGRSRLTYWREQLADAPVLELPTDRPRSAAPAFAGARYSLSLPRAVADGIVALARARGTTPFVAFLAVFQTLLHRYARQDDLIVGTVISGRGRPELEPLVGYFSQVVPLRARFRPGQSFDELLHDVREAHLEAAERADIPFETLAHELAGSRPAGVAPLVQTMFTLVEGGGRGPFLQDCRLTPFAIERGIAKFELALGVTLGPAELKLDAEYRTDLFERSTVERMLAHFGNLLEAVAADPACPIDALPLLSAAERRVLLVDFNRTEAAYPRDATLPDLIARQVGARPDAPAVLQGGSALTYLALHERAEALAARLRRLGVGPGVLAGICLERTPEMLVALLAVLKAGAAYLPLDPQFPAARLALVLQDSGAALVLTDLTNRTAVVEMTREALATCGTPKLVLCLDEPGADAAAGAPPPPSGLPRAISSDCAYVLYTSGSTGRPKGVAVTHRSLVNFLTSMAREPGFTPHDTLLAVTTLAFDIAGLELWLPLLAGGRVVLATRAEAADGARLGALLTSSGATLMQATPATWRLLLAAGWVGAPTLTMLCGGEALPLDLAADLLPRGRALWNMYGPTETTIWSSLQRVQRDQPPGLGCPIANTQLYVLEPGGEPAPFGVAGELHIGGDGVASGYLHRPELTAERFIPHPFHGGSGARLYRTGDLARRRADGDLEFLGRLDQQVKVRGFRIELGEIEAALAASAQVAEVAVSLREDVPGEPRLVAYCVPAGAELNLASVRAALRERLPEYMLPTELVVLPALPLTPNGKLDRKALPAPAAGRRPAHDPPRTAIEKEVAALWARVLEREAALDRTDDFFALGGHSLLAMRLLEALVDRFAIPLELRFVFESRELATMAATVEQRLADFAARDGESSVDLLAELAELSDEEALALLNEDAAFAEASG